MKYFIKENGIRILSILLLGLIFVLWGRLLAREFRAGSYTHHVTTQAARLRCLSHYGWEADPSGEAVKNVTVPDPLDAVFQKYNRLQTPCGFDLERYCGKTVQCYTYPVLNFPNGGDVPIYVNLLLYEDTVIGGDCMSTAIDGFMLPLDRRLYHTN